MSLRSTRSVFNISTGSESSQVNPAGSKTHNHPRRGAASVTSYAESSTSDTSDLDNNQNDKDTGRVRASRSKRFTRPSKASFYGSEDNYNSSSNKIDDNMNSTNRPIRTRSSDKALANNKSLENGFMYEDSEDVNLISERFDKELRSGSKRRLSTQSVKSKNLAGSPKRSRISNGEIENIQSNESNVNQSEEINTKNAKDSAQREEEEDDHVISTRRRTRSSFKSKSIPNNSEDDEYHDDEEESSESASEQENSINDLANDSEDDDDFITSDDDDTVFGSRRRRGRSNRRRTQPSRTSTRIKRRTRNSLRDFNDEDDDFHTGPLRSRRTTKKSDRAPSPPRRQHLRARKHVNYQILPPPALDEPIEEAASKPTGGTRNTRRAAAPIKRLFPTGGPFGGNDLLSVFGNSNNLVAANGTPGKPTAIGGVADSESSDDELRKPAGSGAPPAFSKEKNTLSDSDPLGIDVNIDFSSVGGLDHYINQLKEMVYLPLMYPEVYKRFGITPPRGVLFHGPPGTGKTLMARALASSFSSEDRKVTFFMRKGADCLSKWVGEAERQLRLLFEEAKNKQPSIIFFDEIDGLAPVRSSKQEQIHASIVSTLLALMDGMDNRGQVIVIGATNRPDAIDPALRRPGRFDREFYFPLPDLDARKQIITIQTRKWDPPLDSRFIEHIGRVTKGYGGADLRALCTEAALSAIQTRYPQIYQSSKKLLIDPSSIQVSARDFLRAVDRIIPSSARSTSSLAAPLPKHIEPLLHETMKNIRFKLDKMIPRNKKISPLEEALYEDVTTSLDVPNISDFDQQEALKEFQTLRVFRPRLLIHGAPGMGQQYLASATLQHLEGYHVQPFDLGTLFSDPTRTPEAAIIQLLIEVKRHTPSVIFIPNIDTWFSSLNPSAISTFTAFLRNLNPSDAVLVLGILESHETEELDPAIQSLFGYSTENLQAIQDLSKKSRSKFFETLITHIKTKPSEFPETRKKRKLEELPEAPAEPIKPLTMEEGHRRARKDLQLTNMLKIKLSSIMDALRNRYKRFRKPMVDDYDLIHLFEPQIAAAVANPPYTKTEDDMILDVASGKKYYNMDLDVIEERLWNGFYLEPKQFLKDVRMIHVDCLTSGDRDRILKASEMLTNVEVFIDEIGLKDAQFLVDCHEMYVRRKDEMRKMVAEQTSETSAKQGDLTKDDETGVNGEQGEVETTTQLVAAAMTVNGSLSVQQVVCSSESFQRNKELDLQNESTQFNLLDTTGQQALSDLDVEATFPPAVGNGTSSGHQHAEPVLPSLATQSAVRNEAFQIHKAGPVSSSPLQDNPTALESLTISSPKPASSQDSLPKPADSPDSPEPAWPEFIVPSIPLHTFSKRLVSETKGLSVEQLEQLNSSLTDTVWYSRTEWDKTKLLEALNKKLDSVVKAIRKQRA